MAHTANVKFSQYPDFEDFGDNHLFLVNQEGMRYINCDGCPLPFGAQLVHDLEAGTETAVTQAHTFTVSELALQAQMKALTEHT